MFLKYMKININRSIKNKERRYVNLSLEHEWRAISFLY